VRNGCIWVLITDGMSARICSSANGTTTVLPMRAFAPPGSGGFADDDGAGRPGLMSSKRYRSLFHKSREHLFAGSVARFLRDAGDDGAFSGLIVVATPEIAGALNEALAPETRALLIGQIVRDVEDSAVPELHMSELRH